MSETPRLMPRTTVDLVVPVYNEGENIRPAIDSWRRHLEYPGRVLICYDREDDDTLSALRGYDAAPLELVLVRNRGAGVLGAVLTGFAETTADCVIMIPADDDYNAPRLNEMIRRFEEGHEIVAASRFMRGGSMVGGPRLKVAIARAAAWFMWVVARMPTHDASNGFRLFSRRVIRSIPVESTKGFAFSIELLVKAHRLRWPITEVPVEWIERKVGQSRFQVFGWALVYGKWVWYALQTTYLRRGSATVPLRQPAKDAAGSSS